jgi:hypothetical protein
VCRPNRQRARARGPHAGPGRAPGRHLQPAVGAAVAVAEVGEAGGGSGGYVASVGPRVCRAARRHQRRLLQRRGHGRRGLGAAAGGSLVKKEQCRPRVWTAAGRRRQTAAARRRHHNRRCAPERPAPCTGAARGGGEARGGEASCRLVPSSNFWAAAEAQRDGSSQQPANLPRRLSLPCDRVRPCPRALLSPTRPGAVGAALQLHVQGPSPSPPPPSALPPRA